MRQHLLGSLLSGALWTAATLAAAQPLLPSSWSVEGDEVGALFGRHVGAAGDVNGDGFGDVIVGASGRDQGVVNNGAAHLYLGSPDGLPLEPSWTAFGSRPQISFGSATVGVGDVNADGHDDVLIGARLWSIPELRVGKVLLYLGAPDGLQPEPAWEQIGEGFDAYLGTALAMGGAGDVNGDGHADVLVGHWAGALVEVFLGSPDGLEPLPSWSRRHDWSLAIAACTVGDVNGDGYDDVAVGSGRGRGVVHVHLGSSSGLSTAPDWTVEGDERGARLGWRTAAAGDVNADGFDDLLVSTTDQRVFVFHGSPGGLGAEPATVLEGPTIWAQFGESIAAAGDVDGDGYGDVLVGSAGAGAGYSGRAELFRGSACGVRTEPAWWQEGEQDNAFFGENVSFAGDVDADGFADVLVSAPRHEAGEAVEGKAWLFPGTRSVEPGPVLLRVDATTLSWESDDDCHDVLTGDLWTLLRLRGSFALSTIGCMGAGVVSDVPLPPGPRRDLWFLVRRDGGSYDSWSANQLQSRDAEIVSLGRDCP